MTDSGSSRPAEARARSTRTDLGRWEGLLDRIEELPERRRRVLAEWLRARLRMEAAERLAAEEGAHWAERRDQRERAREAAKTHAACRARLEAELLEQARDDEDALGEWGDAPDAAG